MRLLQVVTPLRIFGLVLGERCSGKGYRQ